MAHTQNAGNFSRGGVADAAHTESTGSLADYAERKFRFRSGLDRPSGGYSKPRGPLGSISGVSDPRHGPGQDASSPPTLAQKERARTPAGSFGRGSVRHQQEISGLRVFGSTGVRGLIALAVLLCLSGCVTQRTPPTTFYLLTPVQAPANAPASATRPDPTIGLGPLQIPAYLDRSQIISRNHRNRLALAEFHQWAEPLSDNISSVIAENLRQSIPSARVVTRPWSGATLDYQVTVSVLRFEPDAQNQVVLQATWTILEDNGRQVLVRDRSDVALPLHTGSYVEVAATMSEALERLSLDIAKPFQER